TSGGRDAVAERRRDEEEGDVRRAAVELRDRLVGRAVQGLADRAAAGRCAGEERRRHAAMLARGGLGEGGGLKTSATPQAATRSTRSFRSAAVSAACGEIVAPSPRQIVPTSARIVLSSAT